MTQNEIKKLIEEGRVTFTGLDDSELVMDMTRNEFVTRFVTHPDLSYKLKQDKACENPEDLLAGSECKLSEDTNVVGPLYITKNFNLDLGGHMLESVGESEKGDTIIINTNETVTIKDGIITCRENAQDNSGTIRVEGSSKVVLENLTVLDGNCVYVLTNEGAQVTIKSGEYNTSSSQAVYIGTGNGKVIIEGGTFKAEEWNGKYYTLNLKDANLTDAKDATKFIEVRGGKFYMFDPSDSKAESAKLGRVSFVPEGYEVVQKGDWYEVQPVPQDAPAVEETEESAPKAEPLSVMSIGNPVAPMTEVVTEEPVATTKKTRAKKS